MIPLRVKLKFCGKLFGCDRNNLFDPQVLAQNSSFNLRFLANWHSYGVSLGLKFQSDRSLKFHQHFIFSLSFYCLPISFFALFVTFFAPIRGFLRFLSVVASTPIA